MQYLPAWLPGMGFKRTAQGWRNTFSNFIDRPHAFVKKQIVRTLTFARLRDVNIWLWYNLLLKAAGKDKASFTSYNIGKGLADSEQDEETLKHASAQLFGAGVDTVSTLFSPLRALIAISSVDCGPT